MAAHHIIILDTDHDLNLYLGLNSWIQIMILKHAPQASFADPFLSLIKFVLVLLATPFFLLLSVTFLRLESACSSSPESAVSLAWAEGSNAVTPTCFWLLVACKISNGGHLRPCRILFLYFFCCSICCPKQRDKPPPYSLPRPRVLSIIPSFADC